MLMGIILLDKQNLTKNTDDRLLLRYFKLEHFLHFEALFADFSLVRE